MKPTYAELLGALQNILNNCDDTGCVDCFVVDADILATARYAVKNAVQWSDTLAIKQFRNNDASGSFSHYSIVVVQPNGDIEETATCTMHPSFAEAEQELEYIKSLTQIGA